MHHLAQGLDVLSERTNRLTEWLFVLLSLLNITILPEKWHDPAAAHEREFVMAVRAASAS
jgi:hypothetical protein